LFRWTARNTLRCSPCSGANVTSPTGKTKRPSYVVWLRKGGGKSLKKTRHSKTLSKPSTDFPCRRTNSRKASKKKIKKEEVTPQHKDSEGHRGAAFKKMVPGLQKKY